MRFGKLALPVVVLALQYSTLSAAAEPEPIGAQATRTRITIINLDGTSPKVVFDSPHRDGSYRFGD